MDVDLLALAGVNASWRRRIDARTLLACVAGEAPLELWASHVATFFTEVPTEVLDRYLVSHGISASRALLTYRAARDLTGDGSDAVEAWLGELADAAA